MNEARMNATGVNGGGSRRRRIIIEQAVDTPDGAGGFSRVWSPQAAVWASFRLIRAGPHDMADRPALAAVWSVRLRWRDDLDGTRRLRDVARIFTILGGGDPDGRKAWLDVRVEEETA